MKKIALEEAMEPPTLVQALDPALVNDEMQALSKDLQDLSGRRLAIMDTCQIEQSVLSLTSPGLEGLHDRSQAITLASTWNQYLHKGIHNHPDRLKAFACLPMHDPQAATEELKRCVHDFGFVGALINGFTPDPKTKRPLYYDDPRYHVFWREVEQLGVPIYLHPRVPPNDYPDAIYRHYPELEGSEWGFHVETGEHVLRLILSGLFDDFPKLKLVIGHMGELLVFWARRIDHRLNAEGWHLRSETATRRRAYTIEHYLKNNFHITTSGYFCDAALMHVIDVVGIDRVCFSVDYPYENTRLACDWFDRVPLSEEDKIKIAYTNAARLLKL